MTQLVSIRVEVRTQDPDFPISSGSDPTSPSGEVKRVTVQASEEAAQGLAAAQEEAWRVSEVARRPQSSRPAWALPQSSRLPLNFQATQFPDLREFYRHGVHGWL